MGRVIQVKDLSLSDDHQIVYIGESMIEMKYMFTIDPEPESNTSQVFKVTVRYKNHQYSTYIMNEMALAKLKEYWDAYLVEAKKIKERNIKEAKKSKHNVREIKVDAIILYIILILGFAALYFK